MKAVFPLFAALLVLAIGCLWWLAKHSGAADPSEAIDPSDRGALRFGTCAVCHGPQGRGVSGKGPSLRGSPLANGAASQMVRAVLNGIVGGRHPDGNEYPEGMTGQAWLPDPDLAAVINHVRTGFDNHGAPVSVEEVGRIRRDGRSRTTRFTRAELGLP